MLLDPFTIGAQILNFLILIWLLRRILYGPVTRAMHEREARVRSELDEARRIREEAEERRERYERERAAFEAERSARLAAARGELEAWRQAQTDAARREIEAMREHWRGALEQEQKAVLRELRRRLGHEISTLTRSVLRDLADADLEERIALRFLGRLGDLTRAERDRLLDAAREEGMRIQLRTAYPLDDAQRERLREGVSEVLGAALAAEFATEPELVGGVELRAGGLKVAWSLREYVESLEEALGGALGEEAAFGHGRA